MDTVLRAHLQTLKDIYKRYSGRDALPNEDLFMSLGEFIDLVTASGIVDDTFGAREIGTLFNTAMMTQVDELKTERHCRMAFVEFLEAIARVADRAIADGSKIEVKLGSYIKRLALTTMGNDYAYQYVRKVAVTQIAKKLKK